MPRRPFDNEKEHEYIQSCMIELKSEYADESQRYAVCKSNYDKSKAGSLACWSKKSISSSIIDVEHKKGIVKVIVNSFDVEDDQNDISLKGSFQKTVKENFNDIFWYLNHDETKMPGITLDLYEEKNGLVAIGQANLNKDIGRDTFSDYVLFAENNRSLQHSIAVKAMKRDTKDSRKVLEWKMREWSTLTQKGSNPITPVLSLKNNTEEEIELLRKALKLDYTDKKLEEIEAQLKAAEALLTEKNNKLIISELNKIINKYK
jgi:hypothetical protein